MGMEEDIEDDFEDDVAALALGEEDIIDEDFERFEGTFEEAARRTSEKLFCGVLGKENNRKCSLSTHCLAYLRHEGSLKCENT